MNAFCGLDFGTSNSTIGVNFKHVCQLVPLEGAKPTLRSAIFCDAELKQWEFGQQGIKNYLEGSPGRLMMALKSVLGSPLMDDKTIIFNEYISYANVLAQFIHYIKAKAESASGQQLTQVVMGRPVHFHDDDPIKDALAEQTLATIAKDVGFQEVSFQFEPIAAALAYEATIQTEQLALIIDMGGGTSDFTIIRLQPGSKQLDRSEDVLANCGIHIAGTDFDKKLSLHSVMPLLGMGSLIRGSSSDIEIPVSYFYDLTTWHTLSNLYDPKTIAHVRSIQLKAYEQALVGRLITVLKKRAGHQILNAVEISKQQLSNSPDVNLALDFIEDELDVSISQSTLNHIIDDSLYKIIETIKNTVSLSGAKFTDINAIFYTGGSTNIPIIREKINLLFPNASIIRGDAFGSVGLGLTIEAQRRYG